MLAGGILLIVLGLGMVFGLTDQQVGSFNLANLGWIFALGGVAMVILYFVRRQTPARSRHDVVVDAPADRVVERPAERVVERPADHVVERPAERVVERRDEY